MKTELATSIVNDVLVVSIVRDGITQAKFAPEFLSERFRVEIDFRIQWTLKNILRLRFPRKLYLTIKGDIRGPRKKGDPYAIEMITGGVLNVVGNICADGKATISEVSEWWKKLVE